jgi:small neutral amino acid transporter SnatA (MarC family)
MTDFVKSAVLLLVLLNPFLVIVYLIDIVEKLSLAQFFRVLLRASLISLPVFCCFAILGDAVFSNVV